MVASNPSIVATLGEQNVGHYIGVAYCFVHTLFIWDLGAWPLYRGGLYSGVAVQRGSTVHVHAKAFNHTFSFLCWWWSILLTPGVTVSSHSSCIERVSVLDHTVYS